MKHEVKGQDDVSIAVGAGGDETIIVVTTTSHVRLSNFSTQQVVMYSEINPPTYPGGWRRLDPNEKDVMVRMNGGGVNLYLRKKSWFRPPLTHRSRADMLDTPVTVEVEGINVS
jgi:hypothetical protein